MDDERFFVVRSGEDGTSIDGPWTEEELLKRITPNPRNEDLTEYGEITEFLDHIPSSDKGSWDEYNMDRDNPVLIIKGRIIVPKPVKTVTKFDVSS